LDEARRQFEAEGLTVPLVPQAMGGELVRLGEALYATRRDLPAGPYEIEAFVREALAGETDDYVLFGQDGHGFQSWAVHYFLVRGHLALFVQVEWGGAYSDREVTTRAVTDAFTRAWSLVEAVDAAGESGRFEAGERLIVVYSNLSENSRWARVHVPTADPAAVDWQPADDPLLAGLTQFSCPGRLPEK